MTHIETRDRVIQALSGLLVKPQRYTLKIGIHSSECTFVQLRKALVKDISKHMERINGAWPFCYIVQWEEFIQILNIDAIHDLRITSTGIVLIFPTYEVSIDYHSTSGRPEADQAQGMVQLRFGN